eukprot:1820372-Prorocentrum_lima.AAC.1
MAPADVSARSMADVAIPPMPVDFPRKIIPGEELTQEEWDALEVHERHDTPSGQDQECQSER